jgi:hypothetical protein
MFCDATFRPSWLTRSADKPVRKIDVSELTLMTRAPAALFAGRPAKFAERASAHFRRNRRYLRAEIPYETCLFDLSAARAVLARVRGVQVSLASIAPRA